MTEVWTEHPSPLGRLVLARLGTAITAIDLPAGLVRSPRDQAHRQDEGFDEARRQLDAYFAGERRGFDLPLALRGTPFRRRVWAELLKIPYGRTVSYRSIACAIGSAGASRAVGAANGANPVPIFVPCHRVIGSGGALVGFGGGVCAKRWLLEHEATHSQQGGLFGAHGQMPGGTAAHA